MTTIKLCEDENGYLWASALPDDTMECGNWPIIGPPEGIANKELHNGLVKAGFYNAFDVLGQRPKLLKLLDELGLDRSYVRQVVHIYQRDYYMEMDE